MKRPPKTDMEIRFRRLLEENFPYTVIQSRKGNIPDWKRAIIDYLFNELNLPIVTGKQIGRASCRERVYVLV